MARLLVAVLCVFSAVVSFSVMAQTSPQAIDLGAFKLIPTLDVTVKHDDNLYFADTNTKDSYVTTIGPELQFVTGIGSAAAAITYRGDYGVYEYDNNDDYFDHLLSADYRLDKPNGMFNLTAQMDRGHDARGEGASEGIAFTRNNPDKYQMNGVSAILGYGTDNGTVGFGLDLGTSRLSYLNNRSETKYRDRDTQDASGRIYLRVSPAIRFFGEYGSKNFDYDVSPIGGGSLDSDERNVSVGFTWEITGKTTGDVKVGTTKKDFDDPARGSREMHSWAASVSWSPKTYSTLVFGASNQPKETNGTGSFIESKAVSLTWAHQWVERLGSSVYMRKGEDNYAEDPRSDDLRGYGAAVTYDMRRWVSVRVFADQSRRNSSTNIYDYDKNVFGITVDMSL